MKIWDMGSSLLHQTSRVSGISQISDQLDRANCITGTSKTDDKKRTGTNPRRQWDNDTAAWPECSSPWPPFKPCDPEPSFPSPLPSQLLLHWQALFIEPTSRRRKYHLLPLRGRIKCEDFAVQCALGTEKERDPTIIRAEADRRRNRAVARQG